MGGEAWSPIAQLSGGIVWLHVRVLRRRVLIMLVTLEASAATNLVTSLAGAPPAPKAVAILLAAAFFLIAASYAFAAEGLLQNVDDLTESFTTYQDGVRKQWADLAWWLGAHLSAIVYGTIVLWRSRG